MHSTSDMGVSSVPAFLTKIWTLVDDPSTDELIAWDTSGMSFHVYDQARFSKEILPHYFKHSNIASFIRQLNMYGFRKVVHVDSGSIKCEVDDVEFQHSYFIRGRESLLEHIKRKPSGAGVTGVKAEPGLKLNQEDVTRVLTDVEAMKGKQDVLSTKMDKMKKENEALWREVALLRQRHMKQQQIVNKLIQFMIHLVGGNRSLSKTALPKRKMPLMINDSGQVSTSPPKRPRFSKQLSIEELQEHQYVVKSPGSVRSDTATPGSMSGSGPVIHDVTDTIASSPINLSALATISSMPPTFDSTLAANGLLPGAAALIGNESDLSISDAGDLLGNSLDSTDLNALVDDNSLLQIVDTPTPNLGDSGTGTSLGPLDRYMKDNPIQQRIGPAPTITLPTLCPDIERIVEKLADTKARNVLVGQLDAMQDDIDSLKDLLSGSQYSFDPNTMLSLFNSDTQVPTSIETLLGDAGNRAQSSEATSLDLNSITGEFNRSREELMRRSLAKQTCSRGTELVQFHPVSESYLSSGVYPDLSDLMDSSLLSHVSTAMSHVTAPMPHVTAPIPHTNSMTLPTVMAPPSGGRSTISMAPSSTLNTPDLQDIVEVDPMSFINTAQLPTEEGEDAVTSVNILQ